MSALLLIATACSSSAVIEGNAASGAGTAVPTVLILDASGSMTETDAPGPRIDAAKRAAGTLIDIIPAGTDFALVAYGTHTGGTDAEKAAGCQDVTTVLSLAALDAGTAKSAVAAITPSGYTPIAQSLRQAAEQLPDSGPQAIVLVSDGEDTCDTPPCDVAQELHQQRPDLTVSTVGFRTEGAGDADLACIASATNGLFVTAENADQLASRLQATQNLGTARTALTSTGLGGAQIGQSADAIRQTNPDLPAASGSGQVVVVWRDCDLTFTDGVLTSIAPHDGGRTIDGITRGSTLGQATTAYGAAASVQQNPDGTYLSIFPANPSGGIGYKMISDGRGDDAGVDTITLCKCLPAGSDAGSPSSSSAPATASASANSDPAALTFGGTAQIQAGMAESKLSTLGIAVDPPKDHGCNSYDAPSDPNLLVVALKGEVQGVQGKYRSPGVDASVHTAEGIHIGNTAARVRQTYSGYDKQEKYLGLDGTNVMLLKNDAGQYLAFSFLGTSSSDAIPDSAIVQGISAGNADFAQGFEICSG